jgi:arginase family enzyme
VAGRWHVERAGVGSEFPFDVARRGYAVGSAVLEAILPPAAGPTAMVPIAMGEEGLERVDGVEAKEVLVKQLARTLQVIGQHDPTRIATLGGECAVSVAPFSVLARRYGDDLAILWIDSYPDTGTPASEYPGFHAMAVAALTGPLTPTSCRCCPPRSRPTASPWSGCTSGPRTTSATLPVRQPHAGRSGGPRQRVRPRRTGTRPSGSGAGASVSVDRR